MTPPVSHGKNRGLMVEEPLLFEVGSLDATGVDLPPVPHTKTHLGGLERKTLPLHGMSEPETVRHFVRLSQKNYSIDTGIFPLGSCSMKHNPRLNEAVARYPGFSHIHPLQPLQTLSGAFELMDMLAHWLTTLTGMAGVCLFQEQGRTGKCVA